MALFLGLMSGTSLDGIDAVLVDFDPTQRGRIAVRAHRHSGFAATLRVELMALNTPGSNELERCELAANAVARAYADSVAALLVQAGLSTTDVVALGAHGQTVRHRPGEFDGTGYTSQLLNGALLAELSGIDVVCDLRRRDVAAGGHGAPLAPAFHAAAFGVEGEARAVLNLGGIANLTLLEGQDGRVGFDCGPASCLLDAWCERHLGRPYDDRGQWGASGRVNAALLASLLSEPYFALSPPKSTGRDLFHIGWLERHVAQASPGASAVDVQATLTALTVQTVADSVACQAPTAKALYVCGGGARNDTLLRGFAQALPGIRVATTDTLGLPVDQVEGAAFAWLAMRFIERCPGNLPQVTGARGPRLLGALYPA